VAPLRLGELGGKQSTPSDCLGGTSVVSMVGEREQYGVRDAARSTGCHQKRPQGNDMLMCLVG